MEKNYSVKLNYDNGFQSVEYINSGNTVNFNVYSSTNIRKLLMDIENYHFSKYVNYLLDNNIEFEYYIYNDKIDMATLSRCLAK